MHMVTIQANIKSLKVVDGRRSTLVTVGTHSNAIRNLHGQFSVRLWQYNSRMVMVT